MTLACDMYEPAAAPESIHLVLMAFSVIAPLVVFLVLPKRMSLGNELRFAIAAALRPLARIASLLDGNRVEAEAWSKRLRRAAQHMAERAHPAGESGAVV